MAWYAYLILIRILKLGGSKDYVNSIQMMLFGATIW